jgi:SAM-dependent methyltransferase
VTPKLYRELAPWFHLLTTPEDYADEAESYRRVIAEAAERTPRTVLELGSGGGNNASHMKAHFELTLVDVSPEMLTLSRSLNRECEHLLGDMRTVRLGRTFDAVFVHDAIAYVTSEEDLRAVLATAVVHLAAGGVALFVPDFVRERFREATDHGGHDGDGRALRYLQWTWDPDPSDFTYVMDLVIAMRAGFGELRVEHDRHICSAWPRATWLRLLEEAGFRAEVRAADHDELEGSELFVAVKH